MKYFAVSDVHSCYTALKGSLDAAGYDKDNPNHTLIIDGDLFDRGDETIELFNFISSIPKERLILIRGNHEDLYLELLAKDVPDFYDFHNGTVKTFFTIAGMEMPIHMPHIDLHYNGINDYVLPYVSLWDEVIKKVKAHPITKFIKSKKWVNHYELDNYIFTHSWFPKGDWRNNVDKDEWMEAHFDYVFYHSNELKEYIGDKTLVAGHMHSRYFHALISQEEDNDDIFHLDNIYIIDTFTIESGKVGVLIIDEDKQEVIICSVQ